MCVSVCCEIVHFLAKYPEMVANRFSMAQPHKFKYKHTVAEFQMKMRFTFGLVFVKIAFALGT